MAEQLEPVRRRVALEGHQARHGHGRSRGALRGRAPGPGADGSSERSPRCSTPARRPTAGPYFVMELRPGRSRSPSTATSNQLDIARRGSSCSSQVCEGVQHAHQKGVIHRDLKPSNVLVTLHDDEAGAQDHRLRRRQGHRPARSTDRTLFTEIGQLIGTPEYMSPEQAEMTGLDVDTRTDVYALGVILYELLVGHCRSTRRRCGRAATKRSAARIREEEPQRPSTRVSTMVMPAVQPGAPRPRVQLGSCRASCAATSTGS